MISINNLSKHYGNVVAVDDLNLSIEPGEVFGFIGPNGAGKTTTIRVLVGLLKPTRGSAQISSMNCWTDGANLRNRIGYLPGDLYLYQKMTTRSLLRYFARLRHTDTVEETNRLARQFDLDLDRPTGQLSKGNRQKAGLIQALAHQPDLLVLDEPTIGIDPIQVVETRKLIQELGRDQTVVLSSHILPEVSMICDRVLIINEGHIVAEDTPKNLAEGLQGVERLEVEIGGPAAEVLPVLKGIRGVNDVAHSNRDGRHTYTIQAESGQDLRDAISQEVVSNGWSLRGLQMVGMSLEEIFLRLTTQEEL